MCLKKHFQQHIFSSKFNFMTSIGSVRGLRAAAAKKKERMTTLNFSLSRCFGAAATSASRQEISCDRARSGSQRWVWEI